MPSRDRHFATYPEALAWLYSTQGAGIKFGLENSTLLLGLLDVKALTAAGGPSPLIFHIAGTNGKGSVCAMLDAVCREAGYRTGLFTSPHLVTFRERIRLNGSMIPEADVLAGLNRIYAIVARWEQPPTFFEITTALALRWFQDQHADVLILETGMGGRLDSTNAVTATVSILTPISIDHRQWLGNSLEEIAIEKAGILKSGVPVVSSPQSDAAARVIEERAEWIGAPLTWVADPVAFDVALPGSHQKLNAALVAAALRVAHVAVSETALQSGLRKVLWPGRFQAIAGRSGVPLVLDGAHNPAAITRLVQTWREVYGTETPVILLSMMRDKAAAEVCAELATLGAHFVVAPVQNSRSCTGEELAQTVRDHAPGIPLAVAESIETGLAQAEAIAKSAGRRVLVTGSLFLVGEVLALLNGTEAEVSVQ